VEGEAAEGQVIGEDDEKEEGHNDSAGE
jgi:hypothetical protein